MNEWWILPFAAIANWQMVETWHHGSLFANFHARLEASDGFIANLLSCPFCLSHWTAALWTAGVFGICSDAHAAKDCLLAAIWWLCTVRLSNLFNDLTHAWCRTPVADRAAMQELAEITEAGPDGL